MILTLKSERVAINNKLTLTTIEKKKQKNECVQCVNEKILNFIAAIIMIMSTTEKEKKTLSL